MYFKVGLLPKDNDEQIPFGYKLYKRTDKASIELCAGFKQTYCQTVKVEFMGVWFVLSRYNNAFSERNNPGIPCRASALLQDAHCPSPIQTTRSRLFDMRYHLTRYAFHIFLE